MRYTPGVKLADLQTLSGEALSSALRTWVPAGGDELGAARLALNAGCPDLALAWAQSAGASGAALAAASALRLGQVPAALTLIGTLPKDARRAVLLARAHWLGGDPGWAEAARSQGRREGDAPALVAAVTLLGETQLADPQAALRTLAEGLKVAELVGGAADAHLLAVLAYTQRFVGSGLIGNNFVGGEAKAHRTAHKALERAGPRSPARVWALLALGRAAEAAAEAEAGQLTAGWWPRR